MGGSIGALLHGCGGLEISIKKTPPLCVEGFEISFEETHQHLHCVKGLRPLMRILLNCVSMTSTNVNSYLKFEYPTPLVGQEFPKNDIKMCLVLIKRTWI
ncbi:hypothetical protein ACFE04_028158 [Oxalis oulophora]